MPITADELKDANADMLGNTNRGILFTTVNLSRKTQWSNAAPRLSDYLSDLAAGIYTWEQFRNLVQQKLTARTFPEFLEKFEPCFYYRLTPPREMTSIDLSQEAEAADAESGEVADSVDMEDGDEGSAQNAADEQETTGEANTGDAEEEQEQDEFKRRLEDEQRDAEEYERDLGLADALPEYEFSLEGGPPDLGWKRVPITMDHPLFKNLAMHLKERALTSKTTVNVSVDDALWGFKPDMAESLLRKTAQDFKSISKKLALESKRDLRSSETRNALEAYDRKLMELEAAIGDDLRVLPSIASGLATARKALGAGSASGAGPNLGRLTLEIGEGAKVLMRPEDPKKALQALRALEAASNNPNALDAGSGREIVPLSKALEISRQVAAKAEHKVTEIVKLPDDQQYPALVGSLMHDMVKRHKIQPVIGNMLSVVLQDARDLATWNLSPKEVEVFHDTFLGIYSMAVENFFKAIVPMFEMLMGVYALFSEFPSDVRRGHPELIVTNDELTDLWRVYNDEMAIFLRGSCLQAARQYRDAISFAIVPSVAAFKDRAPASPPSDYIPAGDFLNNFKNRPPVQEDKDVSALRAEFDALRKQEAGTSGGFGRVAGAPEVQGLMQLGKECGFAVMFSPEKKIIAGRTDAVDVEMLQTDYCPDTVVDKPWAVSGVLCLPDFVVLPPDGMMFTGKVMDGRSVGVDVPQIVVRSCYVAAGRYMANDNPEVLAAQINKLPLAQKQRMKVRPLLPGLSVDLTLYPVLGKTNLAPDHFLSDRVLHSLQGKDKSFLVFSHVHGQSPNIAQPRTLSRVRKDYGERYVLLHHWRQQLYLSRLLYAAYHKGFGGAWPNEEDMKVLMDQIVNWMGWYDAQREGYVNSFPSELEGDTISVEPVTEGGQTVSFIFSLPLKSAVIGPLELTIE